MNEFLNRPIRTIAFSTLICLTACSPDLESIHCSEQLEAIEALDTEEAVIKQQILTKLVLHNDCSQVRDAALLKVSDPELLAKIAIESKEFDLAYDALGMLHDEQLLTKIAFANTSNWSIPLHATDKISDPTHLAKIALSSPHVVARSAAVKSSRLTDQTVLEKMAVQESEGDVLRYVHDKLANEKVRARLSIILVDDKVELARSIVSINASDKNIIRHFARIQAPVSSENKIDIHSENYPYKIEDSLMDAGSDIRRHIARLKLAIQEPLIQKKLPELALNLTIEKRQASYYNGPAEVKGESVLLTLLLREEELVSVSAETDFPMRLKGDPRFLAAKIPRMVLFEALLKKANFSEPELLELVRSEIPEVGLAALSNITSATGIKTAAVEGRYSAIRLAAVKRIADQGFLGQVAMQDTDERVCIAATEGVTDQALLVRIVENTNSKLVKESAVRRINDRSKLRDLIPISYSAEQRLKQLDQSINSQPQHQDSAQ